MLLWTAKDPLEVLDYTWIVPLDTGDKIASHTLTVGSGTAVVDSHNHTETFVRGFISGGTADALTFFSATATTEGGRTFRQSLVLPIINRASEMLATFRIRYPALAKMDDGDVSYWLADAGKYVDDRWPETIRPNARAAWAAHKISEASGGAMTGVTSFKSGTFSATLSEQSAAMTGLSATLYGREFMAMRKAIFAGPIMAWEPGCVR